MTWRKAVLILVVGLLAVIALLWLARARIAAEFAAAYFRNHGVTSSVEIGALGLSGVSGRFALGPADAAKGGAVAGIRHAQVNRLPNLVDRIMGGE